MKATRSIAHRIAHRHRFALWGADYRKQTGEGYCSIDPVGDGQIQGECRGQVVAGYYTTAAEFWNEVIKEIEDLGSPDGTCTDTDCEFHTTKEEQL